jgi:hypothetical protein
MAWTSQLKIIDVFVCKQEKLSTTGGENYIETVWAGYVLATQKTAPPRQDGGERVSPLVIVKRKPRACRGFFCSKN